MSHVRTLNMIIIGSFGRRSDRPVIGGDLVDALVPAGWGRLILVYSQSTSGSTQPGERPVTARSGDVSSRKPIVWYAVEDEQGIRKIEPERLVMRLVPVAIRTAGWTLRVLWDRWTSAVISVLFTIHCVASAVDGGRRLIMWMSFEPFDGQLSQLWSV